ncbi:uncharacterized protein CCR75_005093 [Bremia lactucae]|uniref:E3 ubiquitin protein ligase n=1 Tax=Bremia lactucae TaxID=4779 RepID=A0A976FQ84_BRELC|nr:hypothetical protein CCR75_005093 [Bremia lactucae]
MADTGHDARENGLSHRKRHDADFGGESASKKIKLEEDTPPEANPNTIEAVREKNKALEIDMKEKNRRIAYLTKKCESLYRSRGVASASFRCLRRHWFQLQDELLTAVNAFSYSDEASLKTWQVALDAVNGFGQPRLLKNELTINLPEWFMIVAKDAKQEEPDADVSLPTDENTLDNTFIKADDLTNIENDVLEQLQERSEKTKELLQKLLATVGSASHDKAKMIEYAHVLKSKRAAVAELLVLKSQLQACKTCIADLEFDIEAKEIERHRACRDFDRLSTFVKQQGAVDAENVVDANLKLERITDDSNSLDKLPDSSSSEVVEHEEIIKKEKEHEKLVATMRENMSILSKKLYQERHKLESMDRELDKYRALESAWKNDEAVLIQGHEEKLNQLRQEKCHSNEEYTKLLHKTKDLQHHITEKWEKKITKIQAEMSKTKSQMDGLNLKNVSLREKVFNASKYRDQLIEAKSELQSVKRENTKLKAHVENITKQAQAAVDNHKIQTLTIKVAHLEKENLEIQQAYNTIKQAEMYDSFYFSRIKSYVYDFDSDKCLVCADRKKAHEKAIDVLKPLIELEKKYDHEKRELSACTLELATLRAKMENMKASCESAREENDALLLEIESMAKNIETLRLARKKLIQQIEDKRNANKKLNTLLAREEQAKSHCFEELAAVRLQVSTLSTVHKHQKTLIESSKELLQAKTCELEKLKTYIHVIESQCEATDAEKRQLSRDAEVAKMICASAEKSHQQLQLKKQKPCLECEKYRKINEEMEQKLQHAKSAFATGELTDLERFELRDLQKLVNCSVCQDRRKDVIITKCFHIFCKECIENNLKSRNRKCPTCKKMFGQDDVKTVWFT